MKIFFYQTWFEPIFLAGSLGSGGLKTYFTKQSIVQSSLETLIIGILASAGAYGIGILIG